MGGEATLALTTADDTVRLGETLGQAAFVGAALGLSGPVGAGKSTLAQGFLRALGVEGRVTSPSFTLVRTYSGRLTVAHADLYRLTDAPPEDGDWLAEMVEEADVEIVEWPERVQGILPEDHLLIELSRENLESFDGPDSPGRRETTGRLARIHAGGDRSRTWWAKARRRFAGHPHPSGMRR